VILARCAPLRFMGSVKKSSNLPQDEFWPSGRETCPN
jgi:hypothetical protein